MRPHLKLLIVIADGEHARFVRPRADNALHTENRYDGKTVQEGAADSDTEQPGAIHHRGDAAHPALAPLHDIHNLEARKFGHLVAYRLNDLNFRNGFDDLAIVAPPHSLSAIREKLDVATNEKIIGTLAKDLLKVPDEELWEHVRHWVRPTHRAQH